MPNPSPPAARAPQSESTLQSKLTLAPPAEISQETPKPRTATFSQYLTAELPRTPTRPILTSPIKSPNKDADMPPSSPPAPSPTRLSPQHTPINHQLERMSIDEPTRDHTEAYSDMMVPVSSPPADRGDNAAPTSARGPRMKRRLSFSQMSSSPPDEFGTVRYQPLPESPSVAVMIAEREKDLASKSRERENILAAEKEMERRKRDAPKENRRASPTPTANPSGPRLKQVKPSTGSPPRRAQGITRFRRGPGRNFGRGLNITSKSDHSGKYNAGQEKPYPLAMSNNKGPHQPYPQLASPESASGSASQETVEQLMSEYTNADSYEEVHANLMKNVAEPNLGLQTQVPYALQSQESHDNSDAAGLHNLQS